MNRRRGDAEVGGSIITRAGGNDTKRAGGGRESVDDFVECSVAADDDGKALLPTVVGKGECQFGHVPGTFGSEGHERGFRSLKEANDPGKAPRGASPPGGGVEKKGDIPGDVLWHLVAA